jgi:hypothetical protein
MVDAGGVAAGDSRIGVRGRLGLFLVRHALEKGWRTPAAYIVTAMQAATEAKRIRLLLDQGGAAAGIARREARIDLSAGQG